LGRHPANKDEMMSDSQDVKGPVDKAPEQAAPEKQVRSKDENMERIRKKLEAQDAALQESQRLIQQQAQMLEQFKNPAGQRSSWDDIPDGELIDKAKMQKILEKEKESFKKEAEEIARQTFQRIDRESYQQKLRSQYPDYESVVNAESARELEEKDPEYAALLMELDDEYKKRDLAYRRIKKLQTSKAQPVVPAQQVVEENKKANHYYAPAGQGPMSNPYAFEFDVRSKDAREKAYQKLKSAQKRSF
jgi:hypothetical protein